MTRRKNSFRTVEALSGNSLVTLYNSATPLSLGITSTEGAGLYEGDSALHPVEGGKVSPCAFGTTYTPAPSGLSIHH